MDFKKAAGRVAAGRAVRKWAGDGNVEDLGMSAEYGQDEGMTSTHTQLENDDLENVDSRPKAGGEPCLHAKALPGMVNCPECGAQLVDFPAR